MALSLPSKKVTIADCPEVDDFQVKFVYNFFTVDEKTTEQSAVTEEYILKNNNSSNVLDPVNLKRFVPRHIKISWKPTLFSFGNINTAIENINISIRDNLDKIYNEMSFSVDDFTNVALQDSGKDEKIKFYIQRFIEEVGSKVPNIGPDRQFDSPLDLIKAIRPYVSSKVSDEYLTATFASRDEKSGYYYIKSTEQVIADIDSTIKKLSNIKLKSQVNNKFIGKVLGTIKKNTTSIFNEEIDESIQQANTIQQNAIQINSSNIFDIEEYDLEISEAIDIRSIDVSNFDSYISVVGYIIRKREYDPVDNSFIKEHPPIVVESPLAGSTIDLNAKYGAKYVYTIESVVRASVQAQDVNNNDLLIVTFLLSSQQSKSVSVVCEEYVPPREPGDFDVSWDYVKDCPRITWSFPVEPQRDVKYFQVFKRESIYEPFQMIRMFDFDDSEIKTVLNETPDPSLVTIDPNPALFFLDRDFKKDSKPCIYTVCCLDAHGYSSNYSTQLEVSFDRFKNKVVKRNISKTGAPKAYPNIYVQQDLFVDSIKDSGHVEMKVYFNPEYYKITNKDNQDLKLLRGIRNVDGTTYAIQIINTDLQEQQNVEINVKDIRTKAPEEQKI